MLEGNIKEIRVYYKDSYKYKDKGEIARFVSDEDDDLASSTSVIITKIEPEDELKQLFSIDLDQKIDSQKENSFDFSILFDNNVEYILQLCKVKEESTCSKEFKFNLTVDTPIDVEKEEIILEFKDEANQVFEAKCILSKEFLDVIPCQFEEEIPVANYTLNSYLSYDSSHMVSIYMEKKGSVFPLSCLDEPPIVALIFIAAIFVFVVIVVIIIIIFINKKGKGEKGYEKPNQNFSNSIGFSSSGL